MALPKFHSAKWVGTSGRNFWSGRSGEPIVAIVNHVMGKSESGVPATMASTESWFSNPKSEVSAHYGVSRAGEIVQYVRDTDTAWANGILEDPDPTLPWLMDCVVKGVNPNKRTISIEHENDGVMALTLDQLDATIWLHRTLCQTYAIIPDRIHIIGHSQITGRTRANCPGSRFPFGKIINELQRDNSFLMNGYMVNEPFASFWNANGGLPVFGMPTSIEIVVNVPEHPDVKSIQWFERARFEMHNNGQIMLGLVGNESKSRGGVYFF